MVKKMTFNLRLFFIPCQENNYRPKFLMSKWLLWLVVVFVIAKLLTASLFAYLPKTTLFTDLLAALTKSALVEMTNQERKASGLAPLTVNPKLEEAAYLKAQDMMGKDYFSHQSPTGVKPWDWLKKVNYKYKYAGENLAIGFLDSEEIIKAWDESSSHRANLLNSNYQEIGIAVVRGNFQGSDTTLVVQFLGSSIKKEAVAPKLTTETKPKETAPPAETVTPPEKEILPGEIKEEPKESLVVGEQGQPTAPQIEQTGKAPVEGKEDTSPFRLFRFMAKDYPAFLQIVIISFLFLIVIALILNIFIRIDIQDKGLILRTVIFISLLILLSFINKGLLIKFIPHNPLI